MTDFINLSKFKTCGSYGLIFEIESDPTSIMKIIPIAHQKEKDIINEFLLHKKLEKIKTTIHKYNYSTNRMDQITNHVICSEVGDNIYTENMNILSNMKIKDCLKNTVRANDELGDKIFYFKQRMITPLLKNINKYNNKYIIIAIYQIIEMYESLIKLSEHTNINFGHHDLHIGNIAFDHTNQKYFSAKLLDFGMSCFSDGEFNKCNQDKLNLTMKQHASIDILHLLSSVYVYIKNNQIINFIIEKMFDSLAVIKNRVHDAIHNDFYQMKPFNYLVVTQYEYHNKVDTNMIKNCLKSYLCSSYGIYWNTPSEIYNIYRPIQQKIKLVPIYVSNTNLPNDLNKTIGFSANDSKVSDKIDENNNTSNYLGIQDLYK